jgi:flagellar hook assembly protein FlgD
MRLEFDALKLLSPRPVQVTVYDLAGRVVVRLEREGLAQHHLFNWDGRDQEGRLVSPGTYVVHAKIAGDSRTQTVQHLLPVAY